ncbi:MAG TPA: hypothetical protein VF021_12275 [Longimicrobiales bacterium]
MSDKPEPPEAPPDDEAQPPKDELLQAIRKPKCDLCGSMMVEWHCRMMCPACGYERDCSDP